MRLFITGVHGWVAAAVTRSARARGHEVRGSSRHSTGEHVVAIPALDSHVEWRDKLTGIDAVLHLAARVHVMNDPSVNPLAAFRAVNTFATLNLAQQAAMAGVKRFVFVSSVKVHGESTATGMPFRYNDPMAPEDAYGMSKKEAEEGLLEIASRSGMEVVVVRPPLVYGPGVKANFAALMRLVHRGIPLPLAGVKHNRRSLIALDNLVDLLIACIEHPAAANQSFLASDGEDLSTADLVWRLGQAMNRPARLFQLSSSVLVSGAALLGKAEIAQRLLGSLQVDISHTRDTLAWTPPLSVDEGLRRAAAGYRS